MRKTILLILFFITLLFISTIPNACTQKKATTNHKDIKELLSNYYNAIEQKDYKEMEYYLTGDYEYYDIKGNQLSKKQRISMLKRNMKKFKKIKVTISYIKIFPDNETPHDLKVIYYQTIYKGKHVNRVLKTVRVFKGKETKYKWKIYREFDDVNPDKKRAISYYPVEEKEEEEEEEYEESNFMRTMFLIGNIICAVILISFAGVIIFIFYKSIRLYIFKK